MTTLARHSRVRQLRQENAALRRLVDSLAERVYKMSRHLTLIAERGTRDDRIKRETGRKFSDSA